MWADFKAFWKNNPRVRFWTRTFVAAVGGAIVAAYLNGEIVDLHTLWGAAIAAAFKFLIGFFTPEEPFVGVNKTEVVTPSPPAIPAPPEA